MLLNVNVKKSFCFFLFFQLINIYLCAQVSGTFKVLVFSRTTGFRHASIPAGVNAIKKLGELHNFEVTATENAAVFTLNELQKYKAVVFLSTTGDILDSVQQKAFEAYISQGGGFVGIHAASDTEYDWPWYGELVGTYFESHPPGTPSAVVKVSDHVHPSTSMLPTTWPRTDEWYNYTSNPRGKVHVLATLDESTYSGGNMGADHPIAWCHNFKGGRAWYTGGGHTIESYSEENFLKHIHGGILYAAGIVQGAFDATIESNFELSILDNAPGQAVALEVLNDGKVLYIERNGKLKVYDPATSFISIAGTLNVDHEREDGLLGIVLDPDFQTNHWVYLFYSPAGTVPQQRVSRFVFENNALNLSSEKVILTIPVQRELCCHSGGYLQFDKYKNLYIAVGDNTNPFESDGYSPMDERPGRKEYDSQTTASNTNDLRGKILRITPQPDGSYTIPAGNLFSSVSEGLPEIFVMGTRNPFRFSIDNKTDMLYWGDVGPDKRGNGTRGPQGYDEINRTTTAGNFGWPYCIADNKSYNDYNYASKAIGSPFNCEAPVNNSPNNTGSTILPPAKGAWIWYSYAGSPEFPQLGSTLEGRTAMAGPVYYYDSANTSDIKMPAYFNGSFFIYEWSNNWFREVKQDTNGNIISINPIFSSFKFVRPMDMKFGPDGAVYIIEWGSSYWNNNPDARVIKIGFKPGIRNPVAVISASPSSGPVPLNVEYSATRSYDPDPQTILSYHWDFQNDGIEDAEGVTASFTYTTPGVHVAKLRVVDNTGQQSIATFNVIAGNNRPVVDIRKPFNGGFFDWADSIAYEVSVVDTEDGNSSSGTIACSEMYIVPSIGHNDHAHDENKLSECKNVFKSSAGHGDDEASDNIFYVFNASYKDKGILNDSSLSLSGSNTSLLYTKRRQAEHFNLPSGNIPTLSMDVMGGNMDVSVKNNDQLVLSPANLHMIHHITFRLKAIQKGLIEFRADSTNGELLGTRFIPAGSDYDFYSSAITPKIGSRPLYFIFKSSLGNSAPLFVINWIDFYGNGISQFRPEKHGLVATYFSNDDFTGTELKRNEPLISHHWENAKPFTEIPVNNFSIVWTGLLIPKVSGEVSFSLPFMNGKGEVILDENVILSSASQNSASSPVLFTAGQEYKVEVRYSHTMDTASVKLQWKYADKQFHVIPSEYFKPDDRLHAGLNNEQNTNGIFVYPNPAGSEIFVNTSGQTVNRVTISDLSGKVVTEVLEQFSGKKLVDISVLPMGFYLLKVSGPSKESSFKFIKSK